MIPGGKQEHTFHLLFKEMCIGLSAVLRPLRNGDRGQEGSPPRVEETFFSSNFENSNYLQ